MPAFYRRGEQRGKMIGRRNFSCPAANSRQFWTAIAKAAGILAAYAFLANSAFAGDNYTVSPGNSQTPTRSGNAPI
jgi:hypothetical protein